MEYSYFEKAIWEIAITKMQFHFKTLSKDIFLFRMDNYGYSLKSEAVFETFETPELLLEKDFIDDKKLVDLWDDIVIDFIDDFDELGFIEFRKKDYNFITKYLIEFSKTKELDLRNLLDELVTEERKGNVILYSGTSEFLDVDINNDFCLFFYLPYSYHPYSLTKENGLVELKYNFFLYGNKKAVKLKTKNLAGRLKDRYKPKDDAIKDERYLNMLAYEKLDKCSYFLIRLLILLLSFYLFIIFLGLMDDFDYLAPIGAIQFLIILGLFISYSIYRNKKIKALRSVVFGKEEKRKIETGEIYKEALKEANIKMNITTMLANVYPDIIIGKPWTEDEFIELFVNIKGIKFMISYFNSYATVSLNSEDPNDKVFFYSKYQNYLEINEAIKDYVISIAK